MTIPTFDEYLATLTRLSAHVDPLLSSPETERIREATKAIAGLDEMTLDSVADWVKLEPQNADVLALAVGLTQEKMKNLLRDKFGTSGLLTLARRVPVEFVEWLQDEYNLLPTLVTQLNRDFCYGDILAERAGSKVRARSAGISGRKVEDQIEEIARDLGLDVRTRTRFVGREGRSAPCDLLIVEGEEARIAVAAKGFDSTGSKLSDAYREIVEMSQVRRPNQYIMAVVDGIGWMSRKADLRRIHTLWANNEIDGMYTLASLDRFRDDLEAAARRLGLDPAGEP